MMSITILISRLPCYVFVLCKKVELGDQLNIDYNQDDWFSAKDSDDIYCGQNNQQDYTFGFSSFLVQAMKINFCSKSQILETSTLEQIKFVTIFILFLIK